MTAILGMLGPQLFDDGGQNIPETIETLKAQQAQLIAGLRPAQMFPLNSRELDLPQGCERVETDRGVFHFNPAMVSKEKVLRLSAAKRENELLALGPFNKSYVLERIAKGASLIVITERLPNGVEVRAAAGTISTAPTQLAYFNRSKLPGSVLAIESIEDVLAKRIAELADRIDEVDTAWALAFLVKLARLRAPGLPAKAQ